MSFSTVGVGIITLPDPEAKYVPLHTKTPIQEIVQAEMAASPMFNQPSGILMADWPTEELEHTGLTGGTCPACLAMRATRHMATDFNFIHEPECAGSVGGWVMVTDPEPKTETVTINGLPYHRLVATGTNSIDTTSEGMAGKADEVMKGILDGTLSRPKVKQIGDAVAERTKKDSGGDALGGAIGRSIRHGSFMERRTPYSD